MKSEKEILKLYGVNKKNQIKLKLYQKIITIIGIILLCAFFLSPIVIINIIVIIIFASIILII